MAENDSLNRNQQKAIAALIESRTISDAALVVGVSERTLYRYLENVEFRAALTQAERGLIDGAGFRLMAGQEQALDTLEALMTKARSDNVKRLAAHDWLDFSFKWRDTSIEQRLNALEAAINEHKD
jgi:UDP-N-acetyl-D-mannosaminuronic acid transferase (WecB/TagA/CpsF family)